MFHGEAFFLRGILRETTFEGVAFHAIASINASRIQRSDIAVLDC
ncbi:hypothetical protein ACFQ1S_06070 [Kibdelosporangium lantanae]|uniref:Uncharacterized protein n=1 Tax=Kibdelosporangium lantanae TaxID=1497396 RepID=A0ABW3M5H7_9PSEU